ncbi:MAG: DUF308 domain-containing protein [Muribaculaceae bacterium]|nr:DUF308 domain-containing protein [Muribaculaceae bacterium]
MKKTLFFICYVVGMLIGVMLLIFNYETMNRDQAMLQYTMIAAGVIFIIPGIFQLIASLSPKKDENGNILPRKWYSTVVAIIALLWGIYILIMPLGYKDNLSISLGVSLILAGLAQAVWIVKTSESTFLRFIVPAVTVVVGILVCSVLNHYPDNGKSAQIGAIISGVMLLIWGVNGFFSLRSKRVVAAADKAAKVERKAEKEERKAQKEQAKEAQKEAEASSPALEDAEGKGEKDSKKAEADDDANRKEDSEKEPKTENTEDKK